MPGPWAYRLEITDQVSNFTRRFRPPGPFFYATVSYRGNQTSLPALIDTGADLTVIPHSVALLLALQKFSERHIGTAMAGQGEVRPIFKADLAFLDFSFVNHPMISLERNRYMLIGRDILNLYRATFDGPNLQFNIE
jgi:predicted aspartyl protease